MNIIVKGVLTAVQQMLEIAIPGAGEVAVGVRQLLDDDKMNNADGLLKIVDGGVTALEAVGGREFADQQKLQEGIKDIRQGILTLKAAVKRPTTSGAVTGQTPPSQSAARLNRRKFDEK